MGIFGTSSPFDQDVDKVTSENNTSEDWGLILEICDRAGASAGAAKDCLRAVMRRLAHSDPHVQVQAATLLDACVSNCGRTFHLEVASRDFEAEFRRIMARSQPAVAQRLHALLKKWAEGEFRSDPQLDLIVALHNKLRAEPAPDPVVAAAAASSAAAARERDDLARAIALSLRDAPPVAAAPPSAATVTPSLAPSPAPLYPRMDEVPPRKVRALYDFEAAEDNELTFYAGETVLVLDSSDPNWWKGSNERGEGLFPANFVTTDLTEPPPKSETRASGGKSVQFAPTAGEAPAEVEGEEEEEVGIDEAALDEALALLLEADPESADGGAGGAAEEARAARLEARAHRMGPLIDAALERADRRHARLTQLSADLVDALNLYHELMREPLKALYAPAPVRYTHPPHPPGGNPPAGAAVYASLPHQPHPLPHQPHQPHPPHQPHQPHPPRC